MSAYKFTFKHEGDTMFDCYLNAYICQAINKNGTRCKRTTTIGTPYCYSHLLHIKHLKIKQSTIPNAGKGVFAIDPKKGVNEVVFKKGENIAPYMGELLTNEELENRYDNLTAPFGLNVSKTQNRDAACDRGIGSLINHRPTAQANVKFSVNPQNKTVSIKAIKNIRNGEELFANYSRAYKFNENTTYTTKMSKIK
mgnify:FL=1